MPHQDRDESASVDGYLAACVANILRSAELPPWPDALDAPSDDIATRVSFHGIALLLIDAQPDLSGWPEAAVTTIKQEARLQAFWEDSHRSAVASLVETLHEAGIEVTVMKGTALAYSHYPDPAIRRRGDTDLLVRTEKRNAVREAFRRCGFEDGGERQALQEKWVIPATAGFEHEVDLHWTINASMTISKAFARDDPAQRVRPLPALSEHARGIGPVDSFIQICINRAAHRSFGYMVEGNRLIEGDRLIWAVDLAHLSSSFSSSDWALLAKISQTCGFAPFTADGIEFLRTTLNIAVPADIAARIRKAAKQDGTLSGYYEGHAPLTRMISDARAAPDWNTRSAIFSGHLLPGRDHLRHRYPGSDNWPLAILRLRRLLDAGARMVLGGKR